LSRLFRVSIEDCFSDLSIPSLTRAALHTIIIASLANIRLLQYSVSPNRQ